MPKQPKPEPMLTCTVANSDGHPTMTLSCGYALKVLLYVSGRVVNASVPSPEDADRLAAFFKKAAVRMRKERAKYETR